MGAQRRACAGAVLRGVMGAQRRACAGALGEEEKEEEEEAMLS